MLNPWREDSTRLRPTAEMMDALRSGVYSFGHKWRDNKRNMAAFQARCDHCNQIWDIEKLNRVPFVCTWPDLDGPLDETKP